MSKLKPAVNEGDHHLGNIGAPLTLVEFGDFECSHCGRAHPLVKRLLKEVKDLHFVFRNFPLQEVHPHAHLAAMAAEAAGKQGKLWEMHDLIFEHQDRLSGSFLISLAEKLHLDQARFIEDWKSEKTQSKVELDFESGVRSGVNGTPTFFLNGSPVLTYDETYESLIEAIDMEPGMQEGKAG